MKDKIVYLKTDFENDLTDVPFSEYPRPQLKRESFLSLNGEWEICITNNKEERYSGKILVPFPAESRISGVMLDVKKGDRLEYSRKLKLPEGFKREKVLVHFGACDQICEVFVNGAPAGENIGGYLPFSFDITAFLSDGENEIKVIAIDDLDKNLPYGKQTDKRGGMWYTKISGIWQSVWLESVCENYIERIKITPDLKGVDIEIFGGVEEKTLVFEGNEFSFTGNKFRLDVEEPILWTPENPKLYDFIIRSGEDEVASYFGLRTIGIEEINGKPLITLNGKPMLFHGLLDQGYFSDGIFLPASERGFYEDISIAKECGFNMLRKHIKLEPDIFYYYCDKQGMIVFQDMLNLGRYNFLIDTALPTVFLKKGISHKANEKQRKVFESTCKGIIETLYNHPSVVYYTIFNEGWGQFDAAENYKMLKSEDETRIWDTTSGWFKVKETDVESDHVYFKPVKLKPAKGKPAVLSEFGGYSCRVKENSFNLGKNYGYKLFEDCKSLENALIRLYEEEIIPAISNGLCATVLTQLSDVEDETNGLLTYDRKVLKVDKARFKELSDKLLSEFDKHKE